jgi:capsular exopolysaccharide synthesis family protein
MTTNLITLTDPQSAAAEAYQSLRTRLEFTRLGHAVTTILVAAVDDTADKSQAVANLAVVMAQAGDKVILVDGDLRRPRQHEIFGVGNQNGLTNWLQGTEAPPLQSSGVDGLQLMTAGPATGNPVAILGAKRIGEQLATLRAKVDYVLVDAPPVLAVTDAALWASQVDGVVLLVNAGSTRRDDAQRARTILEGVQAKVLGAVLLNVEKNAAMSGYQK